MLFSQRIKDEAKEIVSCYARYSPDLKCYVLSSDEIPSNSRSLHQLSYLLMLECPEYAYEATSVDNPEYEKIMLPELIKLMKEPTSTVRIYDFANQWISGVLKYHENVLWELLTDTLYLHNIYAGHIEV